MKIEVIPFAAAVNPDLLVGKTAIIIDVLRATSVMITALQNGARELIPCKTVQEAFAEAGNHAKGSYLLCGEREALKVDGFDLGNSPLEYTNKVVEHKSIILTTTNGTLALHTCAEAKKTYIGAFLNLSTIVHRLKHRNELVLVCSGTYGKFSLDDALCAGMIINELSRSVALNVDDLGVAVSSLAKEKHTDLQTHLRNCVHLKYLQKMGFEEDLGYCLQVDSHQILPVFKNGSVVLENANE
jgi:2-phosphosulfolactate phosphatase